MGDDGGALKNWKVKSEIHREIKIESATRGVEMQVLAEMAWHCYKERHSAVPIENGGLAPEDEARITALRNHFSKKGRYLGVIRRLLDQFLDQHQKQIASGQ